MPRNRMIKPDFWNDEKLGKEPEAVQLTFIGTWNFSDDYGVVRANPVWLKNQIYPYKENLRIDAFSKWLEALEKNGMLIKFSVRGEQFYYIRTFRLHQSVEKPSKSRNCTEEELINCLKSLGYEKQSDNSWLKVGEQSGSSRGVVGDEVKRSISISISKDNTPNGVVVATLPTDDTQKILFSKWDEIVKSFEGKSIKDIRIMIEDFIKSEKPKFIDPYMNYWNIVADYLKLAKVQACTDARKNKFKVRINEPAFDFIRILEKIRCSPMLKGETSNWRVSFDWIFENQSNYVKILEGTYDA